MTNKSQQLRQRASLWLARAEEVETSYAGLAELRYTTLTAATELAFMTAVSNLEQQQALWISRNKDWKADQLQKMGMERILAANALREQRDLLVKTKTLTAGAAKAKKYRDRAARLNAEAEQFEKGAQQ